MKRLFFLMVCMALFLVLYFQRFPIFPQFLSVDFEQHVRIATDYANQLPHIVPLRQLLFYGGVEYYLAFFIKAFPAVTPLVITRYAMGLLVFISVPLVWFACKTFFGKAEFVATAIYVFGGFLWFGIVFDSGLYANFYGLIASLLLLDATMRFVSRTPSALRFVLLFLALSNALLSHYSTLLLFPALYIGLSYVMVTEKHLRKSAAIALGTLMAPASGIFVFPDVIATLSGFLSPNLANAPSLTPLASLIPLPSLAYMIAEVAPPDPIRTDLAPLSLFAFVGMFFYYALRRKEGDWKSFALMVWLATVLATGNWGSSWRFAYVGLISATFMAGSGLVSTIKATVGRFRYMRTIFPSRRHVAGFFIATLVASPVFVASWGSAAFGLSISPDSGTFGNTDKAIYQAIGWVKTHANGCGHDVTAWRFQNVGSQAFDQNLQPEQGNFTYLHFISRSCRYATPTDWRLGYSALLDGPNIELLTPLLDTPDSVLNLAQQRNAEYLIVTNIETMQAIYVDKSVDPFECANPGGIIIAIQVLNSTIKDSFKLAVHMDPQITGSVGFYLDADRYGSIALRNGTAVTTITEFPPGQHDIRVGYNAGGASAYSNAVTVFAGTSSPPKDGGQRGYCQPYLFSELDLGKGSHVVYEIPNEVRVWCISTECAKA